MPSPRCHVATVGIVLRGPLLHRCELHVLSSLARIRRSLCWTQMPHLKTRVELRISPKSRNGLLGATLLYAARGWLPGCQMRGSLPAFAALSPGRHLREEWCAGRLVALHIPVDDVLPFVDPPSSAPPGPHNMLTDDHVPVGCSIYRSGGSWRMPHARARSVEVRVPR